jgi:hypothetical protein
MARGESFVSLKIEGLKEALEVLDPKRAQKATASAMKRMIAMVKTEASSVIRDEYAIKKSDLDPFMKVRPPQWNNLTSNITVTGKPISLMYFAAKQLTAQNRVISRTQGKQLKRASRTLQQGVTYQILKGQSNNLPHAFIQYDSRLKRLVVFYRKGTGRNTIRSVNVVTIASLFANKKTMAAIHTKINDNWQRIFKHELLDGPYGMNTKGKGP